MIQLEQKYDREQFLGFLKEAFLKDFEKDVRPVGVDNFKAIKKAYTLGSSSDLDLQVFEFEYSGSFNKRIALAKEAFQVMKQSATFQALAIFYSSENDDWRFSLMTANPQRTEKGNITVAYSNPRRYSFFLGPNAKTNTPTKFLIKNGMVVDFEDLKSRFSLEVVNKEFYKEIAECYTKLVGGTRGEGRNKKTYESILKLPSVNDHSQTSIEFAVRLIGRIIFCWFLREKISESGSSLMPKELLSLHAVSENTDYYHKILEPIFFEILNKNIKSRKPIYDDGYFSKIPYLNGGLFSPQDDDYFSYNEGKQAQNHNTVIVPDDWFNELFQILETYNFTIDENTSIDEELSIDPEMLGRIFENLLAEINPETGESARKSTGSYYTPRVIVDYMVDESLLLYLEQKTSIEEDKLRAIISYDLSDDTLHPLSEDEKKSLVDAIEKVKILDPACGSGAFPIGALQKIVFILQQLDPNGQMWFHKQIQNTSPEIRRVIEREFSHENFDYIRKLGIIRENIYGIDIQPIATEIARLRCFLTLVVDERIDDTIENRGIQPLPNLDFKFVSANSLIGLPKLSAQGELFDDNTKIDELKDLRDRYFDARDEERKDLMLAFSDLQSEMINALIDKHSWAGVAKAELTRKLTDWKPFKHKSTDWFDPEWMFGIKNGFDIVIANPPYLKERDNKHVFEKINNSEFGKKYHQGKMDFWYYFLHKAIDLVKDGGTISYITSRYWLNSAGARKLVQRVQEELSFMRLVDIGKLKVFDEVAGQHMVAVYSRQKETDDFIYKLLENNLVDINSNVSTKNLRINNLKNSQIFSSDHQIELELDELTYNDCALLGTIFDVSQGVVQNPDKVSKKASEAYGLTQGEGVFVLSSEELSKLNLVKEEKIFVREFFEENDVIKYFGHKPASKYLLYITKENCPEIKVYPSLYKHLEKYRKIMEARRETKNGSIKWFQLHWPREEKFFTEPKIVIPGMFEAPNAAFIDKSAYFGLSSNIVIQKMDGYKLKYLLAIINSNLGKHWFYKHGKKRGVGVDIGVSKLRLFPIKIASELEQNALIEIVNKILSLTNTNGNHTDKDIQIKINEYQKQIDSLVYALYDVSPEEVKVIEKIND